ncbi:MAG: WecB/TagA/CpsF family glycosyltransferase [Hespellia sp.]|nr:WecB/TagA/CpsF family glycosyltransferase [Hespellia sp.]
MNDTIQILNIQISNSKTAYTMKKIQQYFQSESLNLIEVVSMDTLLQAEEQPKLQDAIQQFDIVVPGDPEILKAAGIESESALKEIEEGLFWKSLARQLEKRRTKVYLLADSEDELQKVSDYVRKRYHGMQIMGEGILSEQTLSEESVVNHINAAGVECVLGFLSTPVREFFASDNRAWMNAKLWVGMSSGVIGSDTRSGRGLQALLMKLLFRRKVVQDQRES